MNTSENSQTVFSQIRNREFSSSTEYLALCKRLEAALNAEGRLYHGPWERGIRSSTTPPKFWAQCF